MSPSRNDPCPCGSGKKYKHCCESKQARAALPAVELNQLGALLNANRFADVETRANALLATHPDEGKLWQLLAISLQMQSKDGLPAFQKAAELLPNEAGAYLNLGNALNNAGRWGEAIVSYQDAIQIKPTFAEAHNNLGSVFFALGQLENAANSYRRAIQIKSDFAVAHSSLGGVLRDLGQLEEAALSYRRAIKLQPHVAETHNNLGVILRDLGRFEEAILSYRQALKITPHQAEVHSNLGVALRDKGLLNEAIASFQQALTIQPNDAQTLSNLGLVLHGLGEFDKAVAYYRQAIALSPNYAEVHNNLGLTLYDMRRYAEAAESCRRSIALRPNFAEACNNLGNALKEMGQLNDALANYRKSLEVKPDFVETLGNLGCILREIGQFDLALDSFYQAVKIKPDSAIANSNLLFSLSYIAAATPSEYLAEASRFNAMVERSVAQRRHRTWTCSLDAQRLRVGFISGDLCNHPVGYFTESLLAQLDHSKVELIAYTNNPNTDELTTRIKPSFSQWREVFGLNDQAAAQLIHDDGVHILIDLSGHTAKNRLPVFAWKPAPVQCTWLGYFASTGVAEIDYLLADNYMVPPADESHFTETIWRLPDSYLCFTPPNVMITPPTPTNDATHPLTFGSFNNLTKMNEAVIALWSRVLRTIPDAQLFLKTLQLNDAEVCESTRQKFAAHGITEDRLILEGASPRAELLAAYQRVDIALDPFPYSGGTTSVEALWMGVPVLTKRGDRFLSHMGESILHNAGLRDWIAQNEDDYVAKATQFASDRPKLAVLRAGLREQVLASPLFDASRFARDFEDALWGMWQKSMSIQEKFRS